MKDDVLKGFGCLGILAVFVIAVLWGGWVLSVVWNWFLPDIFGLPYLTVPQAMAVSLIVNWLAKASVPEEESGDRWLRFLMAIGRAFGTPAFVLAFGWVLRGFV